MSNVTCLSLLLTGYFWLLLITISYLVNASVYLIASTGYFSLLLLTSDSSL